MKYVLVKKKCLISLLLLSGSLVQLTAGNDSFGVFSVQKFFIFAYMLNEMNGLVTDMNMEGGNVWSEYYNITLTVSNKVAHSRCFCYMQYSYIQC